MNKLLILAVATALVLAGCAVPRGGSITPDSQAGAATQVQGADGSQVRSTAELGGASYSIKKEIRTDKDGKPVTTCTATANTYRNLKGLDFRLNDQCGVSLKGDGITGAENLEAAGKNAASTLQTLIPLLQLIQPALAPSAPAPAQPEPQPAPVVQPATPAAPAPVREIGAQ